MVEYMQNLLLYLFDLVQYKEYIDFEDYGLKTSKIVLNIHKTNQSFTALLTKTLAVLY